MTLEQYQNTNVKCETILSEFDPNSDMLEWLEEYKDIYNKINIQTGNLPAIADCNFNGVRYEHIAKFHSLYHKIMMKYQI